MAPGDKQNQDGGDDNKSDGNDGNSSNGGRDNNTAEEVFREGLKMLKFACTDKWLTENGDDYRQSYVDLFEKFGRDKGL